jgi:hypothetical protein
LAEDAENNKLLLIQQSSSPAQALGWLGCPTREQCTIVSVRPENSRGYFRAPALA